MRTIDEMSRHAPLLKAAAHEYVRLGWKVVPGHHIQPDGFCSCRKKASCTSPGKHGVTAHGHKDASNDPLQVEQWWIEHPNASVFIATGAGSGIDVVDVDTEGEDAFGQLVTEHGGLPDTVEALTGGGGRHLFFRHHSGVNNQTGMLPAGVHVRGDGGYIVAPPSPHRSGRDYVWEASSQPGDVAVAEWPAWLLQMVIDTAGRPRRDPLSPGQPIPEMTRNIRLMQLAGAARRQGAEFDEIMALVRETNRTRCQPPIDDEDELVAIAKSACQYAPAPDPAFLRLSRAPDGSLQKSEEVPTEAPDFTDEGNLERLLLRYGTDIKHCRAKAGRNQFDGGWLLWNGRRWEWDQRRQIGAIIRDTLNAIKDEPPVMGPPRRDGTMENLTEKWHKACRTDARRAALANVGTMTMEISVILDELDQHPWLINCLNGTIDLRTGSICDARREDLLTQWTPVRFDPAAECPKWLAFLDRIMGSDAELVRFIQRAVGYSLTGSTREQMVFFLWGTGANGKSTFLEVLRALIGDYASSTAASTFMASKDQTVRNDLAGLRSARFVSASETSEGGILDEALIKQLSGDEMISARFLYSEYFEYRPQYKIWLATNHKPIIKQQTHAIWRRIALVPFTVKIPDEEQDKGLGLALLQELPGVLNWALAGCRDWLEHGLQRPAQVLAATDSYRQEMDSLGGFISEHCNLGKFRFVEASKLYDAYVRWAESTNERTASQQKFGRQMRERGFEPDKTASDVRMWRGIDLREGA